MGLDPDLGAAFLGTFSLAGPCSVLLLMVFPPTPPLPSGAGQWEESWAWLGQVAGRGFPGWGPCEGCRLGGGWALPCPPPPPPLRPCRTWQR